MERVSELFKLLDDWRKLPAYQLERRADIFFALYMREITHKIFNSNETITIIPEFPIKQDGSNQSDKIDYVVFSENKFLCIELKTDNKSIRPDQNDYYEKARRSIVKSILESIITIYESPNSNREKYDFLMKRLKESNLISEHNHIKGGKVRYTVNEKLGVINTNPEIIYILPTPPKDEDKREFFEYIPFSEVIKRIKDKDSLANLFCESLEKWQVK